MGYMRLFQFWFAQGVFLGVGLLGHMEVLFLVFKGISILSSIVAVPVYIPTKAFPFLQEKSVPFSPRKECSLFSTPSPAFIVCTLFDDGHSDWCEVISHCSFDLHF